MSTAASGTTNRPGRVRGGWRALSGTQKVWLLIAGTVPAAVVVAAAADILPHPEPAYRIPWPAMAALFYLAELAVVHYQFRRDAHSFSMSEVPLVAGLFFMEPIPLIFAQAAGTLIVLTVHRRLPAVKVGFNLTQFALQTGSAAVVFRLVVAMGEPLGPAGWIGALLAGLMALLVADLLINAAIRLSGGRLDRTQMLEVLLHSAVAAAMNVVLGLAAVTILAYAPSSAGLALAPPVVLFVAYRAYMAQRQEGGRLQSLYEATRALHRSPQIESALVASAEQAVAMFDVEMAEIYLFPDPGKEKSYLTAMGPDGRRVVMQPCDLALQAGAWPRLVEDGRSLLVASFADAHLPRPDATDYPAREAAVVPLAGPHGPIGAILVANRLGDVSSLGPDDLQLLEALGSQVAVSLENGRLEDSLAQLTELKEQLEALIASKDQFVASVSHELRTPLTAIFGLSHELRNNRVTLSTAELDEFIGVIASQSSELSDLIEDLLVAARADADSVRVYPVPTEVRDAVLSSLEGLADPGDVEVVPPEAPVLALADPLRLRQILRNLVSNAQRYGGDQIAVEIGQRAGVVRITVVDDGPGVAPGDAEAIFEPYQSAHPAGTQPASVGLGLAVSRRLARLMDGDLVYRRRQQRTVFELSLPAA